jgi:hypothetical protein
VRPFGSQAGRSTAILYNKSSKRVQGNPPRLECLAEGDYGLGRKEFIGSSAWLRIPRDPSGVGFTENSGRCAKPTLSFPQSFQSWLPDYPGFHFAAGLPETSDLNLVFCVIVLIPKETNTHRRAGVALGMPTLRPSSVRNASSLGSRF